jgi:hypothetical protein
VRTLELELGGQGDGRAVEGNEPDGEDLVDVDVEDEVGFVEGCLETGSVSQLSTSNRNDSRSAVAQLVEAHRWAGVIPGSQRLYPMFREGGACFSPVDLMCSSIFGLMILYQRKMDW